MIIVLVPDDDQPNTIRPNQHFVPGSGPLPTRPYPTPPHQGHFRPSYHPPPQQPTFFPTPHQPTFLPPSHQPTFLPPPFRQPTRLPSPQQPTFFPPTQQHPQQNTRPNPVQPPKNSENNNFVSGLRPQRPINNPTTNTNSNNNNKNNNCPFGNFFCTNVNNNGPKPTEPIPLDELRPSISPTTSTTTMSVNDLIADIFNPTTDKPIYDIDVRIDS